MVSKPSPREWLGLWACGTPTLTCHQTKGKRDTFHGTIQTGILPIPRNREPAGTGSVRFTCLKECWRSLRAQTVSSVFAAENALRPLADCFGKLVITLIHTTYFKSHGT